MQLLQTMQWQPWRLPIFREGSRSRIAISSLSACLMVSNNNVPLLSVAATFGAVAVEYPRTAQQSKRKIYHD